MSSTARADLGCALVLLAAIAIVFGQTVGFEFLRWDDPMYVTANPQVMGGLTWDGVVWAARSSYFGLWYPVTWVSHMLDVSLWGMWAGGHHLTSVICHAVASLVLYATLRNATGSWPRALVVSLLFAVHPLRAESVAWISERKDVLLAMFWMATLYFHVRWAARPSAALAAAVWACALLAGMSKPAAVALPVTLVLMDFWPLRRFHLRGAVAAQLWRSVREKWPLFSLALILAAYTLLPGKDTGIEEREASAVFSLAQRLQLASYSYGIYLWKTLWPWDLSFYHPARFPIPWWQWALPVVAIGAAYGAAWRYRAERPEWVVGLSWYCATLLPSSGIIQIASYSHADRYGYIPLVGIYVCMAWAVRPPPGRWLRPALTALALTIAVPMTALAHWQVSHWRGAIPLYGRALEIDPQNRMARLPLAYYYIAEGKYSEARLHASRLLQLDPPDFYSAVAQLYLGDIAHFEGNNAGAIAAWQAAAWIDPGYWRARLRLGSHALASGDVRSALQHLSLAERLRPRNVEVLNNLGVAYARMNRHADALDAYRRAVDAEPMNRIARRNLARTLELLGDPMAALREYEVLRRLDPGNSEAAAGLSRLRHRD